MYVFRSKICELKANLARLNTWWRQSAKVKWIEEGDSNTKFFHTFVIVRRQGNWINQVKHANGILLEDHKDIEKICFNYFQDK